MRQTLVTITVLAAAIFTVVVWQYRIHLVNQSQNQESLPITTQQQLDQELQKIESLLEETKINDFDDIQLD